jgi:hypothetical protein
LRRGTSNDDRYRRVAGRQTMTTKLTKADIAAAATKLAQEKIAREPQRFGKISDPAVRLAAARSQIYREYPDIVDLHRAARWARPEHSAARRGDFGGGWGAKCGHSGSPTPQTATP